MTSIPKSELAGLAECYDLYVHNFDPHLGPDSKEGRAFYSRMRELHQEHAPEMEYENFRREAIRQCRAYLFKNR